MGHSHRFSKLIVLTLLGMSWSTMALPARADWFSDFFRTSRSRPTRVQSTSVASRSATLDTLLQDTNRERSSQGLGNVSLNDELSRAAQAHAEDMARSGNFSHTGSNGSNLGDRIDRTSYSYRSAGENLYFQAPYNQPNRVVTGWLNSPGHRENLLNRQFTEVGFGYASQNGRHYYVQVLGTPRREAQTTASRPTVGSRPVIVAQDPNTPIAQRPSLQASSQNQSQGSTEQRILARTNQERRQLGLGTLQTSDQLNAAAQRHANDMVRSGQFSHTGSDGSTMGDRIRATNYRFSRVAENIAYREPRDNPEATVENWLESTGHRENILNDQFTEIGIGYATDGRRHYYVQVFGTPR